MLYRINEPLLSVIIPVYNVEAYLNKCIKSVVRQTYQNLEIILVDDGSTDGCGRICDEWKKKDPRIRVLHKKNGGSTSARQQGFRLAVGDYVACVDSDDWIEADMYEYLMGIAVASNSDIVTSGLIRDYKNHSIIENEKINAGIYGGDTLYHLLRHVIKTNHFFDSQINMHITNKIFRKERLIKYQMDVPLDAKIGEDADVIYPYIFESKKIAVSGKCFYHYVVRNDSIMGTSITHKESMKIMKDIFDKCIVRNENKIENMKEQLSQVHTFFMCMSDPDSIFRINGGMLYPFSQINPQDKVILYGAGRFGKAIKGVIESQNYCEIVAWADKVKGEGLIYPENISEYYFDKVILAVINATVADDIENYLIHLGINKQKICRINL